MGALFIGAMFLYDFQVALRRAGGEVYAVIDLFPDWLGFLLLFLGLVFLAKKEKAWRSLRVPCGALLVFSVFISVKNTLLFSAFYTADGTQSLAGEMVDGVMHLFKLAFLFLLFRIATALLRKAGEEKLVRFQKPIPTVIAVQGGLYALERILTLAVFSAGSKWLGVLSQLAYLFWVFLIWYAAIALFRMMMRTGRGNV